MTMSGDHGQTDGLEEESVDYIEQDDADLSLAVQATGSLASFAVPDTLSGARLDHALCVFIPELSRTLLQRWVTEGRVQLDGRITVRPGQLLRSGQAITLDVPAPAPAQSWSGEPMGLDIVFEDDALIVVNKPVGLVVHPAAGHPSGTLANGLIGHSPQMAEVPRAGIVHRLDRDTSGLMVAAKTVASQVGLVRQLQQRSVQRTYLALAWGSPRVGTVSTRFGRDPRDRQKMAVLEEGKGKEAVTRIIDTCPGVLFGLPVSLVRCKLETGRTHQIRVHLESIGCPLVGDQTYHRRTPHPNKIGKGKETISLLVPGQALHAYRLELDHPISGRAMDFSCPPPEGFLRLVKLSGLEAFPST